MKKAGREVWPFLCLIVKLSLQFIRDKTKFFELRQQS